MRYIVCGSYPGAIPWEIETDETPDELAARLVESAGCERYVVREAADDETA